MTRHSRLLLSTAVRLADLLAEPTRRAQPGRCMVLYYHEIPAHARPRFAHQLDLLLRIATPLRSDHNLPIPPRRPHLVLTFDDAFVSVLDHALPELRQRHIPSTIFTPSGCLGHPPSWLRNAHPKVRLERVMTSEQLALAAQDPLVTIASHSVSHPNFLELTDADATRELADSRASLEAILPQPVTQFSFPYGAHLPHLHELARRVGYHRVFTSDPTFAFQQPNEFVVGRVSVTPNDSRWELILKLRGACRWRTWLRRPRHAS